MGITKRLLCLANSRKLSHRCVAGKEVSDGAQGIWIRPVSIREHGELTPLERRFDDGRDPQVMDVMDVPLTKAQPRGCQQENWVIGTTPPLMFIRRASWSEIRTLCDPEGPLWSDGHSTARGQNDEIPIQIADTLTSSLRLLRVEHLTVSVFIYWNKKRVQGRFHHAGTDYWLWITDPTYEDRFKAGPEGDFALGESLLTISISEPFIEKNACYKLIAAIMERPSGVRK
jgi:hypothetical protein